MFNERPLIEEILKRLKLSTIGVTPFVENDVYHHNTSYKNVLSVLKYGILSFDKKIEKGLMKERPKAILNIGDKSHELPISNVNDYDHISVAKVYDEEDGDFFYDPYSLKEADLLISSNIKKEQIVRRNSENYCNEFLISNEVPAKYITSIDIRFHMFIRYAKQNLTLMTDEYNRLAIYYNHLVDIADYIEREGILTSLREVNINNASILSPAKIKSFGKITTR